MSVTLLVGDPSRKPVARAMVGARSALARSGTKALVADSRKPFEPPIETDLAVVFGGDGAILAAARNLGERPIPIVGVNLGRLGFLAELDPAAFKANLPRIAAGRFEVEERLRLAVEVVRNGKTVWKGLAVNEGIVAGRDIARMARISLAVGRREVASIWGDGLIAATPSGSTGHSLSAGGPIVEQSTQAIVVTPVCPHGLGSRPIVLSADHVVTFRVEPGSADTALTLDGQSRVPLAAGDEVRFSRSASPLRMAVFGKRDFFRALSDAFQWGRVPNRTV